MSVYVLDTNFFIQAHRATYPLDVATSFWSKVNQLADEEKIISIDKVRDEIYNKNDDLKKWCQDKLPENFFKDTTQVMTAYGQVVAWVASCSSHYLPNALSEFLSADEADAYLVAFALDDVNNRKVVTQEISEPNRKNKIKIPDACNALNIQFVNVIDMFRQLGETF